MLCATQVRLSWGRSNSGRGALAAAAAAAVGGYYSPHMGGYYPSGGGGNYYGQQVAVPYGGAYYAYPGYGYENWSAQMAAAHYAQAQYAAAAQAQQQHHQAAQQQQQQQFAAAAQDAPPRSPGGSDASVTVAEVRARALCACTRLHMHACIACADAARSHVADTRAVGRGRRERAAARDAACAAAAEGRRTRAARQVGHAHRGAGRRAGGGDCMSLQRRVASRAYFFQGAVPRDAWRRSAARCCAAAAAARGCAYITKRKHALRAGRERGTSHQRGRLYD